MVRRPATSSDRRIFCHQLGGPDCEATYFTLCPNRGWRASTGCTSRIYRGNRGASVIKITPHSPQKVSDSCSLGWNVLRSTSIIADAFRISPVVLRFCAALDSLYAFDRSLLLNRLEPINVTTELPTKNKPIVDTAYPSPRDRALRNIHISRRPGAGSLLPLLPRQ